MSLLIARAGNIGGGAGAPADAAYITQTPNAALVNEQALSALATGLLKNTTVTGVLSIAAEGADYFNPPFTDTNALVRGSADPTKLLRWEIDGFTAGATRVMTPPNQDTLLAGQNFANVFTVAQTIQGPTATQIPLTLKTTDDSATNPIVKVVNAASALLAQWNAGGSMDFTGTGTAAGVQSVLKLSAKTIGGSESGGPFSSGFSKNSDREFLCIAGGVTSNSIFSGGVDGDAFRRIRIIAGAQIIFGDGTATQDTTIGRITGGGFLMRADIASSVSAVTTVGSLGHNATGTPVAGFGLALAFQGKSSTSTNQDMGRLTYEWATATHASRASTGKLTAFLVATEVECIRWDATGLVTMPTVGAITLAGTAHAFQTGLSSSTNLAFSTTAIQARSNGSAATLTLNSLGGSVNTPLLRVTATAINALGTTNNALQIGGGVSLANLIFDPTSIQARNNGVAATLNLNPLGGSVKVNQSQVAGAVPTLWLVQADLSEEFIRFESTVGAGNAIDTAALGAYYGKVRVYVEGVGAKWLALYN